MVLRPRWLWHLQKSSLRHWNRRHRTRSGRRVQRVPRRIATFSPPQCAVDSCCRRLVLLSSRSAVAPCCCRRGIEASVTSVFAMRADVVSDSAAHEMRTRVLHAARAEVIARGVLGMRVARVADQSGVPLASMYRMFGGRDGLLSQVLLHLYEETFADQFAVVQRNLGGTAQITVDDIVASLPPPRSATSVRDHSIRNQVMAVASVNPELRRLLSESLRQKRVMLETIFDDLDARLPAGQSVDREVFRVLVFNLNWLYNDLLGEHGVDNERYHQLMKRLVVK
ncbi:MAG: TetR family transcriptional regulator [Acidimicrobiia bacterium]|nr:TetR family transcriptional regulator [Acidimicrobiia bacterium]